MTKLTKAGLIGRRIDRDDLRRSRVDLTKKGARITAVIAARIRPGLAQRLEHLDPERVQAVLECLEHSDLSTTGATTTARRRRMLSGIELAGSPVVGVEG
ncbi:MAG: hypothetical protein ACREJT_16680, partial [Myxococcota bacterium]